MLYFEVKILYKRLKKSPRESSVLHVLVSWLDVKTKKLHCCCCCCSGVGSPFMCTYTQKKSFITLYITFRQDKELDKVVNRTPYLMTKKNLIITYDVVDNVCSGRKGI